MNICGCTTLRYVQNLPLQLALERYFFMRF
nr:MAG TPA: hypothetical protein [Caudoviricetes sp.]